MKKVFKYLFVFLILININIVKAEVVDTSQTENIVTTGERIVLNKHELVLNKGESSTLTVSFLEMSTKNLSWISSDNNIAIVENGKVIARGKGKVVITVTTADGKYTDKCNVTVNDNNESTKPTQPNYDMDVKIKGLMLSKSSILMSVGDTATLRVNISPSNTTEKVIWKSSKDEIATVKDGVITAKKEGEVYISVSSESGAVTSKCKVKIEKKKEIRPDDLKSISFEKSSFSLKIGESVTLIPILNPTTAKANLEWESSNDEIISVKNGVVKANRKGSAVVTVFSKDDNKIKASCSILVNDEQQEEKSKQNIEIKSIRINKKSMTMYEGDERDIVAAVEPVGASDEDLIWKSSDETVAIVENGKINALRNGYAKITVSNKEETIFQTCNVKVLKLEEDDVKRKTMIDSIIVIVGSVIMIILLIILCILNNRKNSVKN